MRFVLILIVTVNLYSQDNIITLSGQTTKGRFIEVTKTHIRFQQQGSKVVSNVPISSIVRVILADGV